MKIKYWIIIIICSFVCIGSGIYLSFYSRHFTYIEEMRFHGILHSILLPFTLLGLIYTRISDYKTRKREKNIQLIGRRNDTPSFIKTTFLRTVYCMVIYFFILIPPAIGLLLFINSNFGNDKQELVTGNIINVVKKTPRGRGSAEVYRLEVQDSNQKVYTFEVDINEIDKYKVKDKFNKTMNKGCLGSLYLKKDREE